jgi:ubiquinone/menaquinone biosynthesis C-methylase UbiE
MVREDLFQTRKDSIRKRLLKYTRKAFLMIPKTDSPNILDVGCGSGISTVELARLSRGKVIGIDIDQPALDKFTNRINALGLTGSVQALNCSMSEMNFPDDSYDIIWSEGSIYAIGFEKGLREWKRFLKSGGYMVVHDERGNIDEKLQHISGCGYELINYFVLDKEVWRTEYFAPLEELITETLKGHLDDSKILEGIRQAQWELDMFKRYPERNNSVCFVIKKK